MSVTNMTYRSLIWSMISLGKKNTIKGLCIAFGQPSECSQLLSYQESAAVDHSLTIKEFYFSLRMKSIYFFPSFYIAPRLATKK